ncbi:vacuolar import and degradation protein-domain-containing protein [Crepidotus variabilis]|uniref:Vacuolar import and degradation protein-domain-containing protein n=1 Tax=Crepidotus variabilis TaxID=179855 RepID=A0A9P6EDC9_9AGAR|nr:vacuolar import and degradation protein-domain-containing protein [Crepidotus variabilis]
MPTGQYPLVNEIGPYIVQDSIPAQQQTKICTVCHISLVDPFTPPGDAQAGVCLLCREKPTVVVQQQPQWQASRIDHDTATFPSRQSSHEVFSSTRHLQESISSATTPLQEVTHIPPSHSYHTSPYRKRHQSSSIPYTPASRPIAPIRTTSNDTLHRVGLQPPQQKSIATTSLNPLVDITFLRHRPTLHQCLYAGAVFQGTQKSGRNSYDVHVTIVDVNFAASTLCGYLRIRGLTDDWPELTTYFDAEIIGSRYGFLTQSWGATQHEDLVHWNRFPAFKHIRHETKGSHMTIDDRDRGCVFMRWKERFLVPDHRVQDINGASFAGFYYVCVELNPPTEPSSPTQLCPARSTSQPMPLTPDFDMDEPDSFSPHSFYYPKPEMRSRSHRDSSTRRRTSPSPALYPPVATMSGFYYHQNSEPYQQLSLAHVPEDTSSSFEFR